MRKPSPFSFLLAVSAVLHIGLIFSLHFDMPNLKRLQDKLPALDVVLVNAKTKSKPHKADALAQANLDRGGNTNDNRQMKSALPPPKQKTSQFTLDPKLASRASAKSAATTTSPEEQELQRVAELEKQAEAIMTQLNSMKKLETQPNKRTATTSSTQGKSDTASKNADTNDLMESSLEIARLEAQIAKQQEEYQKRPKRKSLGARTQEYRFATYVEAWRQKVEKIGNLHYPEAAKSQKLYGQLRMTVSIRSNGSIEKIAINQSSGFRILDDAAKQIVQLAAPYPHFPDSISQDTDVLDITRTWTFTKEEGVATQSAP